MTTPEFEGLYKSLNPAQKKAVDTVEGAVMVVAGPGTGKTTVLTLRIANILLQTQINPENILALTFTESAAHEMRKRLLAIIGHDAYRVEITTFHSFCNAFIKSHQEEFSEMISSENINEIEQITIIEHITEKISLVKLRPLGDLGYYVKPIVSQINELKRENVTTKVFQKGIEEWEKSVLSASDLYHEKGAHKGKMKSEYQIALSGIEKNKELLKVYEEYQTFLRKEKKYDYNDMLLVVIEKLNTHQYLLQYLQEKFQYILVDEHQDTNTAQNTIIEQIAGFFPNPNLFVVGDEKQAIFRFQGATLENFLYFKEKYKDAEMINLSENYRSTQTILDATFSLISQNQPSSRVLSEQISLVKKAFHLEEKISVVELSSSNFEYFWVIRKIKELLTKTTGEKIAILARNNKDLDQMALVMEFEKIPFVLKADNNILNDIDIEKMILMLRAIDKPNNIYVNKILLFDFFGIAPLDAFKIVRKAHEEKCDTWDILSDQKIIEELKIENIEAIKAFFELFMKQKDGFRAKSGNVRMDELFVDVLNNSGLMKSILAKPHAQEILSRFVKFYDEVKDQVSKNHAFSLSDFLKYLDLLEKHKISLKENTPITPDGYVRLMTVHKAKGLEFDYVFVLNSYDGHWGNLSRRGNNFTIPWEHLKSERAIVIGEDKNSDERRLFYVALTRARKNVFMTYAMLSEDGREQVPSQFIMEIPDEYKNEVDTSEFEKEMTNHKELLFETGKKTVLKGDMKMAKEYVAELFRKNGLSVSALNNYIECPWKFFFMNLLRIPEKIDDAGLFGNAVHAALNQYIIALKKGSASREYLLERLHAEMNLQSLTPSEFERFLKRGETALSGFYEERMRLWSKDIESELDIRGIRIHDDLLLNGKIDMITPQDRDNSVVVTDFKTGKVKSRNEIEGRVKNGNGNYKRQLVFYKILLDRYRNGFYKMKSGVIDFVEPTEKGEFKSEAFEVTKEEANDLLKVVEKTGEEIISLSFWDTKCGEKACRYCRLRGYMVV